jgi:hypothetical protein
VVSGACVRTFGHEVLAHQYRNRSPLQLSVKNEDVCYKVLTLFNTSVD